MAQRARDVATTSGKRTIRFQDILAVAREGGWRMSAVLGKSVDRWRLSPRSGMLTLL